MLGYDMASKFEKEALISRRLDSTKSVVAQTLVSHQSQQRQFNASGGSISHILNINNVNQDYRIPELQLNDVYPPNVLPVAVTPGEVYDDESNVYLEQLQNITQRVRELTPTSSLYQRYQTEGIDINKTLIDSGRDFDELGLSQREEFIDDPDSLQVFDFDEAEDRIRKVIINASIINNLIATTNQRIRYSRAFIRNLFQISPDYLPANIHGLNGIYDPSDIPTNVGDQNVYVDDIDLNLERLQNIFDVAEFNFDTLPGLGRRYRDTGLEITESLRRKGVDTEVVTLDANSFETITPEIYDIETISQQVIVLESTIADTFISSIELLYKQTAILNQLPDTIQHIIDNVVAEATRVAEASVDTSQTEAEQQVEIQESVRETLAEVSQTIQESISDTEQEQEELQEDAEILNPQEPVEIEAEIPEAIEIIPEVEEVPEVQEIIPEEEPEPEPEPESEQLSFEQFVSNHDAASVSARSLAVIDAAYIISSVSLPSGVTAGVRITATERPTEFRYVITMLISAGPTGAGVAFSGTLPSGKTFNFSERTAAVANFYYQATYYL